LHATDGLRFCRAALIPVISDAMSVADDARTHLRCYHCGREVAQTMHTRSSYRPDYYSLHTGEVEPATMARSDDPADVMTVMRLIRAIEIFTCVDCYRRPAVRRERELLFRPELATTSDEEAAR
jgi:hypothetical protein